MDPELRRQRRRRVPARGGSARHRDRPRARLGLRRRQQPRPDREVRCGRPGNASTRSRPRRRRVRPPGVPRELTVGHDGNVYVADYTGARVVVFDPDGAIVRMFPDPPLEAPDGGLKLAEDVAVDNTTGAVYVATRATTGSRVLEHGHVPAEMGVPGRQAPNAMDYPRGVAVDPANGNVWLNNTRSGNIKATLRRRLRPAFGSEGFGRRRVLLRPRHQSPRAAGRTSPIAGTCGSRR